MTHPLIGTWRSEANPRAFLRFTEDHQVQGSDGINRLVSTWDEDGTITSAKESSGSEDEASETAPEKSGRPRATIRPAVTTLMATPNLQAWVTGARSVERRGDELVVYDIESREAGTLHRDPDAD